MWSIFTTLVRVASNMFVVLKSKLFYRNAKLILGSDVYVHHSSEIRSYIEIGHGTYINGGVRILGTSKIKIGKYCAIGSGVRIISSNHDISHANLQYNFENKHFRRNVDVSKGPVTIGNNVWVGDLVIVLSGVHIGDGSVLAAGAIVTRDVPPYAIVAGNPAKILRFRFNKTIIKQLLNIKWWNWSERKIKLNNSFFDIDLSNQKTIKLDDIHD